MVHALCARWRLVGGAAILAFLPLPFIGSLASAASCNAYPSGSAPPSDYGAAWNVLSSGKELLLRSECDSAGGGFRAIGVGNASHYIYKIGYRFDGAWKQFEWEGTTPISGTTDWVSGIGTSDTFQPFSGMPNPYYWVGYICQWQPTTSSWKCGCRDSACVTNYWQLQGMVFWRRRDGHWRVDKWRRERRIRLAGAGR
jgi:hypothetical protein